MENKKRYLKFIAGFLGIIAGVFVLYGVGMWGWQKYEIYKENKAVEEKLAEVKKIEQENYERMMADTYGGKTPQETLQMYIDAVEKGDFELASRYYIGDKQKEELKRFEDSKDASKETVKNYVEILKSVINNGGKYALDGEYFSFYGEILVQTRSYPNGIWKIIEI